VAARAVGRGVAAVAAWVGLSHLVAAGTGYRGCPEIGAIATLVLRRPLATNCDVWDRIDKAIGAEAAETVGGGNA
jgi:hypothetical protein